MKTLQVLISLVSFMILMGCQAPQSREVEVSILLDITNSTDYEEIDITPSDVLYFFSLEENPYNYGRFQVSTLTETHLSRKKQIKLPPVVSMDSYNKYSRENMIHSFKEGIDSLLYDLKHHSKGKQASSIFIPLSREFERLVQSEADKKILLCFTDLFENTSSLFSVYSTKESQSLLHHPEKLTKLLTKNAPLPKDLKGIEVYLIYSPNIDTDSGFLAISQWYKELLETRGAEVYIGANLVLD